MTDFLVFLAIARFLYVGWQKDLLILWFYSLFCSRNVYTNFLVEEELKCESLGRIQLSI